MTSPLHPAMQVSVYHNFCILSKAIRKNPMLESDNIKHKQAVLPEAEYVIRFYSNSKEFENIKESIVNHSTVKEIIDNVLYRNILDYKHLNWLNKLKATCDTARLHPVPDNYQEFETYKELTESYPDRLFLYLNMEWDEGSVPIQLEGEKIVEVMNENNSFELAIYRGLIGIINGVNPIRKCSVCDEIFPISSKGKGQDRKYCSRSCGDKAYRKRKKKYNE